MAVDPSMLSREYYMSPEIFAAEMARIYSECWICIGREESPAAPGEYRVVRVGGESLVIVRGRDDVTRAFYNVCRHRGSPLCTRDAGRLSGALRCPYHAWSYGLDGRLLSAPHMADVPGFDAGEYPLVPAALATWQGFHFVSLAAQPEPIAASYGRYDARFAPWELAELRTLGRIEYDVQANWKLIVENYSDCYHCRVVHPELNRRSDYRNGVDDLVDGFLLGGYMWMNEPGTGLTRSGRPCAPTLPGLSAQQRERVYYRGFFPNLLVTLAPEYVMTHTLWPLAPDRTRVVCEWLFASEASAHPDDAVSFWDQANREDWEACERTQQGVSSRAFVPGPACGEFEKLVVAFDREVMKALAHG